MQETYTGLIPGLGRFPGGGLGNPLQYFCLENPMDGGAWWATVHRVARSWTQLKLLSMHDIAQVQVAKAWEHGEVRPYMRFYR